MENVIELRGKYIVLQDEISEMIPNPAGLPCTENHYDDLTDELDDWKKVRKSKAKTEADYSNYPFWETPQSHNCVAL